MKIYGYPEYEKFCVERQKDLQRIARNTRGTHDLSDVKTEAWLMAEQIYSTKAVMIVWTKREDQDLLLSYLYQHLVRYTELHLRYAVRLDHWTGGGMESKPHPLLNKLVADASSDPLAVLSAREEALLAESSEPDCHYSLASAYVHLLRRFENKMSAVADHLLISLSYCYARYARVRLLAELQRPIPIRQTESDDHFIPGAWRRFRLRRAPLQLAFDFDTDPTLTLASG